MKKILAIDFGTKRIGLAISRATLAEPLVVLANDIGVFGKIIDICQQEVVTQIIVGISENIMAEKTRKFTNQLKSELKKRDLEIKIDFFDETLSSQEVQKKLLAAQTKKSKRQGPIDHYAAAVILEEWLG